ncbi:hypothetical protein COCHEDRAFT_1022356, partial [Bipolaris maydis C5]
VVFGELEVLVQGVLPFVKQFTGHNVCWITASVTPQRSCSLPANTRRVSYTVLCDMHATCLIPSRVRQAHYPIDLIYFNNVKLYYADRESTTRFHMPMDFGMHLGFVKIYA